MTLSRILVVKLSSLGDVVHALPVAGALRRRFPHCHLTWLAGSAAADVARMCGHVDRVVTWNPGKRPRLPLVADLRSARPQVALDVQGVARTTWLTWLSGARWRIGFRSWQEGAFALCNLRVIPPRTDIHAVDAYLEFARFLGADGEEADFGLRVPAEARERAIEIVAAPADEPTVALLPGTRWPTKKWPAEHFAALAVALGGLGVRCVVLGSREDREAGETISAAAPDSVRDLTGRTSLAQSAAVIAECALAVGNDSGPMHLSAALGVPVIGLFGPTDPVRTGPYGAGHVVLRAPVPCGGCRRRRCRIPCMGWLSPEGVLEEVRRRLGV